jgi:peptidoglycan/xylan/chitin deacetylase (PgdA/CDA1 family)
MAFSAGGATSQKRKIRKNNMASKYSSSSFDEMLNENREKMRELTGEKEKPVQPSTQSASQSPPQSSEIAANQLSGSAKGIPFSLDLQRGSRPDHRDDRTGARPVSGSAPSEPTRPYRSQQAAAPSPDAAQVAQKSRNISGGSSKKEIFCAIGVDVDAVAGWLGSYGGEDSPCDISRGLFSGEVGIPRMLKLFDKLDIKTTWFIPGHSIETFPEQCKMVVDGGHEVGMHGYSHENPIAMTPVQEEAVMDKCIDLIEDLCGRRPTGYVAPWWEFSPVTNELLLKKGIKYDHSLMNDDFHPFYVRVGDSWTKIDYSKHPDEWMKPLVRGIETDLVDIPGSWYLDDLPPMMFIKSAPNSHGFVNPRDIGELWRDQFDWVYREFDYAVYTLTIHPDVSGRPQVLMMLEKLLQYIQSHEGIKFCTFDEIADDFIQRNPRKKQ